MESDYPKTLYPRVGGGSIVCESAEHHKRLGEGWVHHPPFVQTAPEWNPLVDMAKAEADKKAAMGNCDLPKRRGRPPKQKEEPVEAT